MVSDTAIRASNARIDDDTGPNVAIFVGGTSGIGKLTIRALVETGITTRIYMVGRKSSEECSRQFMSELHQLNSKAQIVWVEAEISLLAEIKRICDIVKSQESRLDLLFLTAGYAPFNGRRETSEGIEIVQSLEYYSRIACVLHLLPLLRRSENARVISVLGGGMETKSIDLENLDLRKPGSFGGAAAQGHYIRLNSITLDKLAEDNQDVTFVHAWPGWVNTGNVGRSFDSSTWFGWLAERLLGSIVGFFSIADENVANRYLFQCTSAAFGGRGVTWSGKAGVTARKTRKAGVFLVNYKCDSTPNAKVMAALRETAQQRVWDHTMQVLQSHL